MEPVSHLLTDKESSLGLAGPQHSIATHTDVKKPHTEYVGAVVLACQRRPAKPVMPELVALVGKWGTVQTQCTQRCNDVGSLNQPSAGKRKSGSWAALVSVRQHWVPADGEIGERHVPSEQSTGTETTR